MRKLYKIQIIFIVSYFISNKLILPSYISPVTININLFIKIRKKHPIHVKKNISLQ